MGSVLSSMESMWSQLDTQTFLLFLATFVGVLVLQFILRGLTGPRKPPGPRSFPLVGSLLSMRARPMEEFHLLLEEYTRKYGDVFTLNFMGQDVVFLNSVEVIKEAFHRYADVFSERPGTFLTKYTTEGGKGVIWGVGDIWKGLRRFSLHALRDLGVGKLTVEERIVEEAVAVGKVLASHNGTPLNIAELFHLATTNVICSVCFGSRFDYDDSKFREIVQHIEYLMAHSAFFDPIQFIKPLQYLPFGPGLRKILRCVADINTFMLREIKEHEGTFDKNNVRDLIDLYLLKKAEDHEDHECLSEANIRFTIRDLFAAGSDTTATALTWGLLHLITKPDIQQRLHTEIDEVIGSARRPCSGDRNKMPYMHAFIMEVLRHTPVAPTVLPHNCIKDTQINGYTIPANAFVLANIYSIHRSEKYWDKPQLFDPNRFLSNDGKPLQNEAFLAFGLGPRQCLGESMARREIFLILTYLLQNFNFKMEDEDNPPSVEGITGMTLAPKPFKIRAIPK